MVLENIVASLIYSFFYAPDLSSKVALVSFSLLPRNECTYIIGGNYKNKVTTEEKVSDQESSRIIAHQQDINKPTSLHLVAI